MQKCCIFFNWHFTSIAWRKNVEKNSVHSDNCTESEKVKFLIPGDTVFPWEIIKNAQFFQQKWSYLGNGSGARLIFRFPPKV